MHVLLEGTCKVTMINGSCFLIQKLQQCDEMIRTSDFFVQDITADGKHCSRVSIHDRPRVILAITRLIHQSRLTLWGRGRKQTNQQQLRADVALQRQLAINSSVCVQ